MPASAEVGKAGGGGVEDVELAYPVSESSGSSITPIAIVNTSDTTDGLKSLELL